MAGSVGLIRKIDDGVKRIVEVGNELGVSIAFAIGSTAVVVLWMLEFLRHLEQMEALGFDAQEIRQMISER
jgi:hypothetical protein